MTTIYGTGDTSTGPAGSARAGWSLIAAALGFVLLYLSVQIVSSSLASSAMPLPNASADETRTWFAQNQLASVLVAVCQFLSVACLAAFVIRFRRVGATARRVPAGDWTTFAGLAAVALIMLSSVLAWLLAALAPSASLVVVAALRTASFITGGTAHVVALGVFVLLASRLPEFGKPVRVLGYVAAVPAVASLVSLVWFQGAALILLGRLLCMVWTVSAAVSLTRRPSTLTRS